MRALGTVRKVDSLGRVSLPQLLRSMYDIKTDDSVEMYQEGENIILEKYTPKCIFCGGRERVESYKSKSICHECMDYLRKSSNQ